VKDFKRPDYYTRCGPGRRHRFAAFDFETEGLGGKLLSASYITEDMYEAGLPPEYIGTGDIFQKIIDIQFNNNQFHWFAHNLQYELRYYLEKLEDYKDRIHFFTRTDSDVFMLHFNLPEFGEKAKLVLRDSMALWPETLEKFGAQFCPEIPKLDIDLENVIFDPKNPSHIEYSKRDSLILLVAMIRFDAMIYEKFDVHVRSTAASTALAGWQRTLEGTDRYYNPKENEPFIRSAYYGGLVFLTSNIVHDDLKSYDINSSYAYQMMQGNFPMGKPARTRFFSVRDLGIYRVIVKAPVDLIVPILPKRDKKGIVWPKGVFETTVTSEELAFAVQHNYRILQILEGLVWDRTCSPFEGFVKKCMMIRFTWPGTALDRVAKLMQNSVYGKFGAKRTRRKIYGSLPEDEQIGCEVWGEFYIRDEFTEDMQCLPQWAVFITARARLHLLRQVYAIGPQNALYGETDSITVRSHVVIEESTEYGGWKRDKKWVNFKARGPKIYAGHQSKSQTGGADIISLSGAAKGLPKRLWTRYDIFSHILKLNSTETVTVEYDTLEKFVISLKTRYIGQRHAKRSLSTLSNSRSWQELANGDVRPHDWSDIEKSETDRGERSSVTGRGRFKI